MLLLLLLSIDVRCGQWRGLSVVFVVARKRACFIHECNILLFARVQPVAKRKIAIVQVFTKQSHSLNNSIDDDTIDSCCVTCVLLQIDIALRRKHLYALFEPDKSFVQNRRTQTKTSVSKVFTNNRWTRTYCRWQKNIRDKRIFVTKEYSSALFQPDRILCKIGDFKPKPRFPRCSQIIYMI